MPEQVKIDKERRIAEIISNGMVTVEHMVDARERVARAYISQDISGLLHDVRGVTQPPNRDDLLAFARETIGSGIFHELRIALLTNEESAMPHSLMAATAIRMGKHVRVFSDRQAAITWLVDGLTPIKTTA